MTRLKGPRAKFERAENQLDALYVELSEALDPSKNAVAVDIEAEPYPPAALSQPWVAYTVYVSQMPTVDVETGLRIGEILHNLRGSLDHTAWILVRRRGNKRLSEKQARRVQFPLARTSKTFWNETDRLPGVPADPYWTLIERYQPYKRSRQGRAMRRLRMLTDLDKHRILLPVFTTTRKGHFELTHKPGVRVLDEWHMHPGRELKRGTKLITVVLSGDPAEHKVRVDGNLDYYPVFPRSLVTPRRGSSTPNIATTLNMIRKTCGDILSQIEAHL